MKRFNKKILTKFGQLEMKRRHFFHATYSHIAHSQWLQVRQVAKLRRQFLAAERLWWGTFVCISHWFHDIFTLALLQHPTCSQVLIIRPQVFGIRQYNKLSLQRLNNCSEVEWSSSKMNHFRSLFFHDVLIYGMRRESKFTRRNLVR